MSAQRKARPISKCKNKAKTQNILQFNLPDYKFLLQEIAPNLEYEEENLHPADDWEAGEESQCSPDSREFVNSFSFLVLNYVKLASRIIEFLSINSFQFVLSMVILSNVEVSKKILTKWSLLRNFKSLKIINIYLDFILDVLPLRS